MVLLGVGPQDTTETAEQMADKIAGLRCFEDAQGKTNLSVQDVNGSILLVSQFTLYADTTRGRRPGFTAAADPAVANPLFDHVATALRNHHLEVQTGHFGALMQVHLTNHGPFTIFLEL
jgi:D-aminoacyl-tRNA deacylase